MDPPPQAFLGPVLLVGLLMGGCILPAPGPAPAGWQHDAETGVTWRALTASEMAGWQFEAWQAAYAFRVPGLMERLRTDDQVTFEVRIHGGFIGADLTFREEETYRIEGDDPRTQTTRWFDVADPWGHAYLSAGTSLSMEAHTEGWRYWVMTTHEGLELEDDVRPDDLVSRIKTPCEEWSETSHNTTAACLRHAEIQGR